ncbi:aminotransferase class V-fold PLP-dependent enzyme [uncultured Imperialibacter sp.]|uniref:aminotransferase class V-fold PLP-dependent enzyme n=1 Tax=uncultured Imperialibacter sp. TaxID=1672639 RepID=UPI0030D94563
MLDCQRDKFFLPEGVPYLNCAYMSPMMIKVEEKGIEGMQKKRFPYQVSPQDFFSDTDELRNLFAEIIDAPEANRIVVIPSVSYGMATVTRNLKLSKGDEVIVAGEQFPSNVYPWMNACRNQGAELKIIAPPELSDGRGKKWNENILEAISSKTKLVAISHCHWADGTVFELKKIRQRTREVGALLVIDGTQSVGAFPFSVKEIEPDALVCAGYKWLMGPYSIGLAYYGPHFDNGSPVEENWINRFESEDFTNLINYQENYQPGALRYEVGEHSNFILVPMLKAALKQIIKWQVPEISGYCTQLTREAITILRNKGYLIEDDAYRSPHLFGVRFKEKTSFEKTQALLQQHKVSVSVRGTSIRISPNVYNNFDDISVLLKCFE